jgi:hypothetical protein
MRRLTYILEILGFATNRSEGKKLIVGPDAGWSLNHYMRMQHTAIAQHNMIADHTKRANGHICADFGLRGNDSGRMNHGSQ